MKWSTRTPCKSCPYRRDAPLGFWAWDEFVNLEFQDSDPVNGHTFGCHGTKSDPDVCAGWLLDQKRRGLPSIQLRLHLMTNEEARECLEQVNDGGHVLYDSIAEMIEANRGYE